MRWKDNAINKMQYERNKLLVIAKVLDKMFMAQRSKGRMSLDWWYSWILRCKTL